MILELIFNNYKMFKSENVLFFFVDTRIKRLGSNYFRILNRNVLKSVSLYGQNNIGTSGVLGLLRLIKALMLGTEDSLLIENYLAIVNIAIFPLFLKPKLTRIGWNMLLLTIASILKLLKSH